VAIYLKNHKGYEGLPEEVTEEVEKLSPLKKREEPSDKEKGDTQKAVVELCPDPFVYPGTNRSTL